MMTTSARVCFYFSSLTPCLHLLTPTGLLSRSGRWTFDLWVKRVLLVMNQNVANLFSRFPSFLASPSLSSSLWGMREMKCVRENFAYIANSRMCTYIMFTQQLRISLCLLTTTRQRWKSTRLDSATSCNKLWKKKRRQKSVPNAQQMVQVWKVSSTRFLPFLPFSLSPTSLHFLSSCSTPMIWYQYPPLPLPLSRLDELFVPFLGLAWYIAPPDLTLTIHHPTLAIPPPHVLLFVVFSFAYLALPLFSLRRHRQVFV